MVFVDHGILWVQTTKQLLQVLLFVVHHEEEVVERGHILLALEGQDDVVKLNCVYVVAHLTQLDHDLNFSENLFGLIFMFEDIFYKFDGEILASLAMLGLHNLSEATFSKELDKLIVFLEKEPVAVL